MHGQVWDLVFQTIVKITLPRVIPTLTYHSDILSDILILSGILPRIYSDILPGMPHSIRSWRYGVRVQAPCTASGPRHMARTRSCPQS
jgi:hypothetical protein